MPVLAVTLRDIISRHDYPLPREGLSESYTCVAAVSQGPKTPQAFVTGGGTCLIDQHLHSGEGDNVQFAKNLIRWLGGERTYLDVANEARSRIYNLELLLMEVIVARLAEEQTPGEWWHGLPESLREKLQRQKRPDTLLHETFQLSDKLTVVFKNEVLTREIGIVGGRSKTKSEHLWRSDLVDVRNRVSHPERLSKPVRQDELDLVQEFESAVRTAHKRLCVEDDDPRR